MKKFFACAVALLAITGCESPNEPNHGHWTIAETSRGFIAIQDDWRIEVQNGDLDNGVVTGVHVSYKLEPIGGGGIYDLFAEGRYWNEWVPLLVPTRPGYSALKHYRVEEHALIIAFEDSIGPTDEMVYPHQYPLKFDLKITLENNTLDFVLGGMHMVFPAARPGDTLRIDVSSTNKQDTTLVITHHSPNWAFDFTGPSTYECYSAHFYMRFETYAPLTKLGIYDGGIKFDLDHSLIADPPEEYVNSHLIIRATGKNF